MKKVRLAVRLGFVVFLALLPDPTKASEIDCFAPADPEISELRLECTTSAIGIFYQGSSDERWSYGLGECVEGPGPCVKPETVG